MQESAGLGCCGHISVSRAPTERAWDPRLIPQHPLKWDGENTQVCNVIPSSPEVTWRIRILKSFSGSGSLKAILAIYIKLHFRTAKGKLVWDSWAGQWDGGWEQSFSSLGRTNKAHFTRGTPRDADSIETGWPVAHFYYFLSLLTHTSRGWEPPKVFSL